jgi:hypothetical protein
MLLFKGCVMKPVFLQLRKQKTGDFPITYVENEDIIKEYADGRKEILGHIKPNIKLKKRVYKIQ